MFPIFVHALCTECLFFRTNHPMGTTTPTTMMTCHVPYNGYEGQRMHRRESLSAGTARNGPSHTTPTM